MTRRRGLSRVLDTIFDAARQGFDPVKVPSTARDGSILAYAYNLPHISVKWKRLLLKYRSHRSHRRHFGWKRDAQ